MKDQIKAMEQKMAAIAGVPVEMTIRGEKSFTFATEERNETAAQKLANFFKGYATVSIDHDDECGSFVYVEA